MKIKITHLLVLLAAINLAWAADLPPKSVKMDPPAYPPEAKAAGAKGNVTVKYTIDDAGRIESASVVKSSGSDLLDAAAIDAVMNYQFEKPNYAKGSSRPSYIKVIQFDDPAGNDNISNKNYSAPVLGLVDAKLIETTPTVYPAEARALKIEGKVVLELQINEDGKLKGEKIVKSSGYAMLDDAALETVKNYKYAPATLNGKQVASAKALSISFKLTPGENEEAENQLANKYKLCGDRINNPAFREKVAELMKFSDLPKISAQALNFAESSIKKEIASYITANKNDLLPSQQKEILDAQSKVIEKIRSELGWGGIEPVMIQSYCDTYTDEEIDGIVAFYKSPIGQSLKEKAPSLTAKITAQMQSTSADVGRYVYETLQSVGIKYQGASDN